MPVIGIEDEGLDRLLNVDVVARVSDRRRTINGPQSQDMSGFIDNYQDTKVNAGCGSTRSRTPGGSLFPYDLEPAWCQGVLNNAGVLAFEGVCVLDDMDPITETPDDAVFAKIYVKLYDELLVDLNELACTPLGATRCAAAVAKWNNGKGKLTSALENSIFTTGNCSGGTRNFGAVASQLQNYGNILVDATLGPYGSDSDNRVAGQGARVETLLGFLKDKVKPSIPGCPGGLLEADSTWTQ